MAVILRTYKTIRTHWKKSIFGACIVAYGISSAKTRYDTNVFMQVCCKEAMKYGEELLPVSVNPRSITVILNPAANKRKAKADYEKFCEPLFHLAGISVTLLQTNAEGHAKDLVQGLSENESIVVAGGDGTVSEAITGLLREDENKCKKTIGILPLGRRNLVGNQLFPVDNNLPRVKQLTEATMAVIKNHSEPKNVMKIEAIETETEMPGKPIFAMGAIEWGAFRDAYARRDKYWIYGGYREYATFLFNGYKSSLSWDCKGSFKYTPPCDGCNNCRPSINKPVQKSRWLDLVMPKVKEETLDKDYTNISNQVCNVEEEKCFKTTEVKLTLEDGDVQIPPHLSVSLGKMNLGYFEYVSEGWNRLNKNPPTVNETITARMLEIHPLKVSHKGEEIWFAIDNEEFDVKPIKITCLPKAIKIFTKQ